MSRDVRSVARFPLLVKPAHHSFTATANFIDRVTDSCVPDTPRRKITATALNGRGDGVPYLATANHHHDRRLCERWRHEFESVIHNIGTQNPQLSPCQNKHNRRKVDCLAPNASIGYSLLQSKRFSDVMHHGWVIYFRTNSYVHACTCVHVGHMVDS
jgi:hypothetical protein